MEIDNARNVSAVSWINDTEWQALPVYERALVAAAFDADRKMVREKGTNSGPEVEKYLSSVGLGAGFAWCAAFVTYHCRRAGLAQRVFPPRPASACSWLRQSGLRIVRQPQLVSRGDLFGWCDKSTGRGHIGFVVRAFKKLGLWWMETIEGNTGPDGSREGYGVFRRKRRWTNNTIVLKLTEVTDDE